MIDRVTAMRILSRSKEAQNAVTDNDIYSFVADVYCYMMINGLTELTLQAFTLSFKQFNGIEYNLRIRFDNIAGAILTTSMRIDDQWRSVPNGEVYPM